MRVGLTGGIASGKSTASAELKRLGVDVIDYDLLAREVIAPGSPGAMAVLEQFGELDRGQLAALVFASEPDRKRLESIVHPLVYQAAAEVETSLMNAQTRAGALPLVVHEIPLLAEVVDPGGFDQVIVVDAPASLRKQRLVEGRGMSPEEASARIAAQADDEARRAIADIVWDGSASPKKLRRQVRDWLNDTIHHKFLINSQLQP